MNCKKCGKLIEMEITQEVSFCPYCGEKIELVKSDIYENKLKAVLDNYGYELLNNQNRLLSIMSDILAGKDSKILKLITYATREDIPKKMGLLRQVSKNQQKIKINQMVKELQESYNEEMSFGMVNYFSEALGFEILSQKYDDPILSKPIPSVDANSMNSIETKPQIKEPHKIALESENAFGNFMNYGLACLSNNNIIYGGKNLYKSNIDGSAMTKINSNPSLWLNTDCDWIYYCEGFPGEIYRISCNGDVKQRLVNQICSDVYVADNWVYYLKWDKKNPLAKKEIWRSSKDGRIKSKVTDSDCKNYCVDGNWIFYKVSGRKHQMYKIHIAGVNETFLFNCPDRFYFSHNGWLYFLLGNGRKLYKVRESGSESMDIISPYSGFIDSLHIGDPWIYFGSGGNLFRIFEERGNGERMYIPFQHGNINKVGDWLILGNKDTLNNEEKILLGGNTFIKETVKYS